MKKGIEFFRKCLNCDYETPTSETFNWIGGFMDEVISEIELSKTNVSNLLGEVHQIKGIVCENCGHGDKFAFAVIRINDKSFGPNSVEIDSFDENNNCADESYDVLYEDPDGDFRIIICPRCGGDATDYFDWWECPDCDSKGD